MTCAEPHCVCLAVEGTTYCSIHRKCRYCHNSHADRAVYRCTQCGRTLCVGLSVMDPDPTNKKLIRRAHKDVSSRMGALCGPLEATDQRVSA